MTDIYEKMADQLCGACRRGETITSILRSAFVPRVEVGEPVAWAYDRPQNSLPTSVVTVRHASDDFALMASRGWTETPLYPEAALATLQAQLAEARAILSEFTSEYAGFENGDGEPCHTLAKATAFLGGSQ